MARPEFLGDADRPVLVGITQYFFIYRPANSKTGSDLWGDYRMIAVPNYRDRRRIRDIPNARKARDAGSGIAKLSATDPRKLAELSQSCPQSTKLLPVWDKITPTE